MNNIVEFPKISEVDKQFLDIEKQKAEIEKQKALIKTMAEEKNNV